MADLPYYYEDQPSWRKYAEGLVPIIIILLIVLVLVGKTSNVFCTIPGLNAVFCGGSAINIALIGSFEKQDTTVGASNLQTFLDSDTGRACNMQAQEFSPEELTYITGQLLKNYDLVVLSGERNYTRPVREALQAYLQAGGKMVIIGDAGTADSEDNLYNGWGQLQVPVTLRTSNSDTMINGIPTADLTDDIMLRVVDMNHPIVAGYGFKMNLSMINKEQCNAVGEALRIVDINPNSGTTVMTISGYDASQNRVRTFPAVVESQSLLGGKVYYFSFDPGCMTNMWISTVQDITGKNTCVIS